MSFYDIQKIIEPWKLHVKQMILFSSPNSIFVQKNMLSVDQQGIKNGCCLIILSKSEYTDVSSFQQLFHNIYSISQIFVLCGKGAAFYQTFCSREWSNKFWERFCDYCFPIFCLPGESFEECDQLILWMFV